MYLPRSPVPNKKIHGLEQYCARVLCYIQENNMFSYLLTTRLAIGYL